MAINANAIELETRIREDALAEEFERTGKEYRGNLVEMLKTWAALDGEWADCLAAVTLEWVDRIRALLVQRRPPWRPTLNCPSCNQRFHGPEREPNLRVEYWNHDEEKMNHPSLWTAGCDGCGAGWAGDQMAWLSARIAPRLTLR
ncbi:hypothetical protein ABH924_001287 [Arthrobacter sp. GAS37]|uniref:hypothetical protein n=1 Tax=Arthrobacter sp. GAS37 TaxID=3156261 RepID=UPI00383375CB